MDYVLDYERWDRICPECGKYIGDEIKFCVYCGAELVWFSPDYYRKYLADLLCTGDRVLWRGERPIPVLLSPKGRQLRKIYRALFLAFIILLGFVSVLITKPENYVLNFIISATIVLAIYFLTKFSDIGVEEVLNQIYVRPTHIGTSLCLAIHAFSNALLYIAFVNAAYWIYNTAHLTIRSLF